MNVDELWAKVKVQLQAVLSDGDPETVRASVAGLLGPVLLRVDPATGQAWGEVSYEPWRCRAAQMRSAGPTNRNRRF